MTGTGIDGKGYRTRDEICARGEVELLHEREDGAKLGL